MMKLDKSLNDSDKANGSLVVSKLYLPYNHHIIRHGILTFLTDDVHDCNVKKILTNLTYRFYKSHDLPERK